LGSRPKRFAAINMFRGVAGEGSLSRFFTGHIGAMIAMALGGLLFAIGIVIAAVNILSRVLQ
jgi:cbb3-type cytochrome oxidase subunit 1